MPTLFYDITKARRQGHFSGLNRVSSRLQLALRQQAGFSLKTVHWSVLRRGYVETEGGRPVGRGATGDAFFTPEVFALRERPFCRAWLKRFNGFSGTLFYDAIPYIHPEITWPHSVRRFPRWFADLQAYKQVCFISRQSLNEAVKVHQETGLPLVQGPVLSIGSDYRESRAERIPVAKAILLNVGIIEPRKGQDCLMSACEALWSDGFDFKLVFLGRVNPHYGKPLIKRIRLLQQAGHDVVHEDQVGDDRLAYWHQRASLAVLPSRREGFGLPVLEALWSGCPVVASDQPSLDDVPAHRGVRVLPEVSAKALEKELQDLLANPDALFALQEAVPKNELPTWNDAARQLVHCFGLADNS